MNAAMDIARALKGRKAVEASLQALAAAGLALEAVHGHARDAEFLRDLRRRSAGSLQPGNALAIDLLFATLVDALSLRPSDAFGLALPADVGFELGKDAQHVKKRLPGGCGCVYWLLPWPSGQASNASRSFKSAGAWLRRISALKFCHAAIIDDLLDITLKHCYMILTGEKP